MCGEKAWWVVVATQKQKSYSFVKALNKDDALVADAEKTVWSEPYMTGKITAHKATRREVDILKTEFWEAWDE
jgi:hypothetical protein